ncbi:UbiA prenyltransferase family [Mycena latifolia]|nr:UbiA prenyltransferase family [Mycena latifolia]
MNRLQWAIAGIVHELDIFFAFSWRDWSTTLIPGSIWGVGAAVASPPSPPTALFYRFPRLILWVTFFVYFFTLSNQIVGVDEDRVNKPDRPIPSGKVTLAGAKRRVIVVLGAFLVVSMVSPRLLPEWICWVLTTGFLCFTSAGNHWFGKNNVGMTLGTWALLSASWRSISPYTPRTQDDIVGIALWTGLSIQLQDLRDLGGDLATGRKTMAVVYGDILARRIIAYFILPAAIAVLWFWSILAVAPISLIVVHVFLGYRVVHAAGGPRYDHKTYMMWTYAFCFVIALLAFKDVCPTWLLF